MDTPPKPRLRGVFHQWAFVGAVAAGIVLVALAHGTREMIAAWIYVVALAAMFGASAMYHRFPWHSAAGRARARRVDHSMIFLFIAATYTPFALLSFTTTLRWSVLATVWAGAALGIVLTLCWIDAPKWVTALAYLAVGCIGIVAVPEIFSRVGTAGGLLIVVGSILYTLGALIYAFHWPNPFPQTLGFHEIFHLLVVMAVAVHCVAVYSVVV